MEKYSATIPFSGINLHCFKSMELTEKEIEERQMRMVLLQAIDYAKRHQVTSVESWSSDYKFHHVFTREELEAGMINLLIGKTGVTNDSIRR